MGPEYLLLNFMELQSQKDYIFPVPEVIKNSTKLVEISAPNRRAGCARQNDHHPHKIRYT